MALTPQRRRKRLWVALLLVACAGATLLVARSAGRALVVSDPLQSSQAVVVFGGQVPFRAMEAAVVYQQGLAREVWVTQGVPTEEDIATAALGIDRPADHTYSVKVLQHAGVPNEAIRVLTEPVDNTANEVRVIAAQARASQADRVILITSKYHSRRVRVLWNSLVGAHPQAIVRYTPRDPFEPEHWWQTTTDVMAVSREWFGLLNAWAGFPVPSARAHSPN